MTTIAPSATLPPVLPAVSDEEVVARRVEHWSAALVDLTTGNPLVNVPEAGCVEFTGANETFELLASRRKSLTFWDLSSKTLDRAILREAGNQAMRAAQFATLRHLHLQAQSLLEGQDINILYVAFGQLTWKPTPDAAEPFRSPLLLLPVVMERTEDGNGYRLTRMEEDTELNPVLRLQMRNVGLEEVLPQPPEEGYLVPTAYFRQLADRIEGRDGWKLNERCCLGRFPVLKMRLFEDLTQQRGRAALHPVVAALAGDRGALVRMNPGGDVPPEGESEGLFRLLDADPAQERAITAAARGESFVLHGPAGTGKTQTITNIVGERLAAGKTVLLVSGRMASLDAVYRRLADRGLGDLCLVAHSLRTSKRDLLGQLEASLSAPKPAPRGSQVRAAEAEEWEALRDGLDAVARELHAIRQPLGLSVYEAAGIITEARRQMGELPPLALTAAPPDLTVGVSAARYGAMEEAAQEMASDAALRDAAENPWAAAFNEPDRADLAQAAQAALSGAAEQLDRLQCAAGDLAAALGMPPPTVLTELGHLLRVTEAVADLPATGADPILLSDGNRHADDLRATAGEVRAMRERLEAVRAAFTFLMARYEPGVLHLPFDALRGRLTAAGDEILTPIFGADWRDCLTAAGATTAEFGNVLGQMAEAGRLAHTAIAGLSERTEVPHDNTAEGRVRLLRVVRLATQLPHAPPGWFTPGAVPRLLGELQIAERQYNTLAGRTAELLSAYKPDVLDLDHDALLQTVGAGATGVARLFNAPAIARDMKVLRGALLPEVNVKERDIAEDLALAKEVRALRDAAAEANERLTQSFGGVYFKGQHTDWEGLRTLLKRADLLAGEFPDRKVPVTLILLMTRGGDALAETEAALDEVTQQFGRLRAGWDTLARLVPPTGHRSLPSPMGSLLDLAIGCEALRDAASDFVAAHAAVTAQFRAGADAHRSVAEMVADLDAAHALATEQETVNAALETLRPRVGAAGWAGRETDWNRLAACLEAVARLREVFGTGLIPASVAALADASAKESRELAVLTARDAAADRDALLPHLSALRVLFTPSFLCITGAAGSGHGPEDATFPDLADWLRARRAEVEHIEAGRQLQNARDRYTALGLTWLFDAVAEARRAGAVSGEAIVGAFRLTFHQAWLDATLAAVPELRAFQGTDHAAKIERFRLMDKKQMETVPGHIREAIRSTRAPKDFPQEVKLLKERLARRRPGEVRKLLAQIPNLLPALKPCVMMNPLSVRLYLDPDALPFDTVIFDDASQLATEDGLGAVLRGRQVIIAGDQHQIPPLALIRDAGHTGPHFESILDTAVRVAAGGADGEATAFGYYPLNWHYRSRHESLIAFSRRFFYPDLRAFPAAEAGSAVELRAAPADPAEGVRAAVDGLITCLREQPGDGGSSDQSAGIICLTEADYEALLDEVARRRAEESETLPPAFADGAPEPLFVKTVENVQGDERDVVLLYLTSVENCAALREEGGERLLNVATTRARRRLIVVDGGVSESLASAEATEDNGSALCLLKEFLRFAASEGGEEAFGRENGATALVPAAPFEETVAEALTAQGCVVRRQVGTTDYRVDLAVMDPSAPGRYALGVVCDGPAWADSPTARHRDRLRTEMLTERGWALHRAYSLDWARDPESAARAMASALKKAISTRAI
jgi:hypothetical protein